MTAEIYAPINVPPPPTGQMMGFLTEEGVPIVGNLITSEGASNTVMLSVYYMHKLYVQSPVIPTFFEGICFLWPAAIDVSNIHLAPL